MMGFIILWIVMGVIVAMVASSKGQSVMGWFFYGAIIWPIALVHALLLKPETGSITPHAPSEPAASGAAAAFLEDTRACPFCAETIKKAAKVCRFCNREVEPS